MRSGRRGHQCISHRKTRATLGQITPTDKRRWKYGLSRAQFNALVEQAQDRCMICDIELNGQFHIDHCHETGAVRGILCKRCNLAIGWFDDDPSRVLAAHFYLIAHAK